jgi:phospholipid transport system substrate-binding protein
MKMLSAVGLIVVSLILPITATAGAPADQVRETVDQVLAIVKQPQPKSQSQKNQRRKRLKEVISQRFDFSEMARRSLGSQWRRLSPQQQHEFIQLFTRLLEDAYLDKIESYHGEKVQYVKETVDNDYAQVDTKITDTKGQDFSVDYRLHNVNGNWKVYDVVIEDVSLVNNYRAQFNRVLAKSSVEDLLKRMKEKTFSAPV